MSGAKNQLDKGETSIERSLFLIDESQDILAKVLDEKVRDPFYNLYSHSDSIEHF